MRHWVIIYQKLIWINFITLKANENEFLEKANTSTVGKFASTEQWVHSICVFVLCAYVEECPCFMEQQHRSFHSLWTGTHVPETHTRTHAWVKLLTVLNRAASLSLKPLKCGSSSSSPSAVWVKPTPPLLPRLLLPVPQLPFLFSH